MNKDDRKREGIKCTIASASMLLAAVLILDPYPGTRELGEIYIKFLAALGWFIILVIPLLWNHPEFFPPEKKGSPKMCKAINVVARSAVVAALFVVSDYVLMVAFVAAMVLSRIVLNKMYAR